MTAKSRRKGGRVEREVVARHLELGIFAERVPLSGAARYRGGCHDVDIYLDGEGSVPLRCEVKARASGKGFVVLERWLGNNDALFLRRNNGEPIVVLPWSVWARIIRRSV